MGEFFVYLIVNGERFDLSESAPLQIIDIANLGPAQAERITERSPAQDGDTDIGYILEARSIPIVLQAIPSDTYPYKAIRDLVNRLFKATNANMQLGITFEDDTDYRINVKSVGNVALPLNLTNQAALKIPVRLRAATPTFFDPILKLVNFNLTGAGATLVPTAVPVMVGGSTIDQLVAVAYAGTYRSLPVITITGPITNPKIVNLSTGLKIDFTGITIAPGDYYTVDLSSGRKLVYRNGNPADNRIAEVTTDSNLAFFAIEADPDVTDGINEFYVTGTVAQSATSVLIQYYDRFDGI